MSEGQAIGQGEKVRSGWQSPTNGDGIIRIGRKGMARIAIGEDGEPKDVDVIAMGNAWADVDRQYRDEKGDVQPGQQQALNVAATEFVRNFFNQADISTAEALEFLKVITVETKKLQPFFALNSETEPSSPAPSELIFSAED